MLVQPSLDELLPKVETRYTLAMVVAKRARQLVDGAQPMIENEPPNLVTLACQEINDGKIACVAGIHKPVIPIRPEIEEARRIAAEQAATAEQEARAESQENNAPAVVGEQAVKPEDFAQQTAEDFVNTLIHNAEQNEMGEQYDTDFFSSGFEDAEVMPIDIGIEASDDNKSNDEEQNIQEEPSLEE